MTPTFISAIVIAGFTLMSICVLAYEEDRKENE